LARPPGVRGPATARGYRRAGASVGG
jgi:hypothetical protein